MGVFLVSRGDTLHLLHGRRFWLVRFAFLYFTLWEMYQLKGGGAGWLVIICYGRRGKARQCVAESHSSYLGAAAQGCGLEEYRS